VFSRRAVLGAGLAGATGLAYGSVLGRAAARAATTAGALGTYDFNQGWLFGGVYVSGSEGPGYPDGGFAQVTVPHTVTPLSWGGWDHTAWEKVWIYRKHFNSSAVAGGRVFVDFQAVMTTAAVYLGGTQISQHQGGFLPWSAELTSHIVPGDNVLAVKVDSTWQDVPPDNPQGAWSIDYLMPGGIYRDVGLRVVPQVFIADVFAKPTNVLTNPDVEVQVTIDAATVPKKPLQVKSVLYDGATALASATTTANVTSTGQSVVNLTIGAISGLTLWSPGKPKLYQVRTTISGGGIQTHTLQVTTGFREATFELDGFYLNGSRFEIFGINRHQLFPYTGMAAPSRLQRRDAELLKRTLNCNMVRCSHYPQSPHFLDACDQLGLMVWQEPPGWQYMGDTAFQNLVVQNVNDMVIRDRNRPSVIVWATRLNETANYATLYAQTRQLCYTLDGSRQSTGAVAFQNTSGWAEDMYAYDDYHSSSGNAILEPPISGVPYMVSEAVGALDGAPLYRWIDTEQTLAIQAKMHAQVHNIAQGNDAYAGLLGWAGIDYASLSGGNRIWKKV
jgi:beta-galactosidase